VEDPNPIPGMTYLDLRLVRVNQDPQPALIPIEGSMRRNKEGGVNGSDKILLGGDGDSNKMNTASNTRLRLTTQVSQAHAATGVLLDLGINSQPHRPENAAEHKTRASLTYIGQVGEHHRSDWSLLVKLGDFHRIAVHWSDR
jgi:hypothetical protein